MFCKQNQLAVESHYWPPTASQPIQANLSHQQLHPTASSVLPAEPACSRVPLLPSNSQPAHSGQPESSAAAPNSLQCSASRTSSQWTLTTALHQSASPLRPTWVNSSCTQPPPVFCQQNQLAVESHYCPPTASQPIQANLSYQQLHQTASSVLPAEPACSRLSLLPSISQPAHSGQPESSAAAPNRLQCSASRTSLQWTLTTALHQSASSLRPTWVISSFTQPPPVFCQQNQLAVESHYCPPTASQTTQANLSHQ